MHRGPVDDLSNQTVWTEDFYALENLIRYVPRRQAMILA